MHVLRDRRTGALLFASHDRLVAAQGAPTKAGTRRPPGGDTVRFRTITIAAALAAVLGAAAPAFAHDNWGYGSRYGQWHQRYDRDHWRWHRRHERPRYFRYGSYGYYGGYRPYYYDYSYGYRPGCHQRSYWDY
jgi:hypothetical protein